MSTQLNSAGTVNKHNRKNAQDETSAKPDGFKIYPHFIHSEEGVSAASERKGKSCLI